MCSVAYAFEVKHSLDLFFHLLELLGLLPVFFREVVFEDTLLAPVYDVVEQSLIDTELAVLGMVFGNQVDLIIGKELVKPAEVASFGLNLPVKQS